MTVVGQAEHIIWTMVIHLFISGFSVYDNHCLWAINFRDYG